MVKKINDINEIVSIWSECFGDTKKDICFFVNNINNACCIGNYSDKLESMLFLVDCNVNGVDTKYIYAACTYTKHRKKQSMTKLLDYCKNNYERICLIPANVGLIDFYKKRGFTQEIDINSICFNEVDEIIEYLFDGCELHNPFALMYKG